MKKAEVEQAMDTLIDRWAEETHQPMPPDGKYHYSFSSFWAWLENNHRPYTQFRTKSDPQDVMEIWFDKRMRQSWRN